MDITLSLEEDFALMYKGNMEIVSVCFPSGWTPVSKLGENLMSIHNPIADNEQLLKSSKKIKRIYVQTKHKEVGMDNNNFSRIK